MAVLKVIEIMTLSPELGGCNSNRCQNCGGNRRRNTLQFTFIT